MYMHGLRMVHGDLKGVGAFFYLKKCLRAHISLIYEGKYPDQ